MIYMYIYLSVYIIVSILSMFYISSVYIYIYMYIYTGMKTGSFQRVSVQSPENLSRQFVDRKFPCQKIRWNFGILHCVLFLQYIVDLFPSDSIDCLLNSSNKVLEKNFKLQIFFLVVEPTSTHPVCFPLHQFSFQIIKHFLYNVYYF